MKGAGNLMPIVEVPSEAGESSSNADFGNGLHDFHDNM